MNLTRKTIYIPAPVPDTYRQWKTWLRHEAGKATRGFDYAVIDEVPNREVHWLARWGLARLDGRADFIPAQGGCVVYVTIKGIGWLSRVLLAIASASMFDLWRPWSMQQPTRQAMIPTSPVLSPGKQLR